MMRIRKLCCLTALVLVSWQAASSGPASGGTVSGEIRVLLVVVDANRPVPRSLRHYENEQVAQVAWTDASTLQDFAFERESSFAKLYEEMSYGQLTITGDTLLVAFPHEPSDRTWRQWVSLADAEALSQGFDLSAYDRFLYLLPYRPSDATTAGLSQGNVGWCAPYSYVELGCLFHELGHMLGLSHAGELRADGTSNGMGDDSDGLMGSGFNCQVNAVNKFQAGWLAGSRLATVDEAGSASFTLAAQSVAEDTLQVIEIANNGARPVTGVVDTFVSFRDRGGFDGQLAKSAKDIHGHEVVDAVLVHQRNRLFAGETFYRRALSQGERFDEHGVTVTATSVSGDRATVTVSREPYDPQPHLAVITPANIDSEPQQFQYYDLSITNTNDPAQVDFESYYDVSIDPPGPGWVVGWATGAARTVAPGQTRDFPLIVMSPSSVAPGPHEFTVVVTELDGDGGPYSVEALATYTTPEPLPDPTSPGAPTNLNGAAKGAWLSLTWSPAADASGVVGYQVLRETGTAVGDFEPIGATAMPGFADVGVAMDVPYRYVVRAFDASANLSPASNIFSITLVDVAPPSAPTGLAAAGTASALELSWNAASDDVALSGYELLRDGIVIATTPTRRYEDADVSPGETYAYSVRAFDAAGNIGPESSPVIATPPSACGIGPELLALMPVLVGLRSVFVARRRPE